MYNCEGCGAQVTVYSGSEGTNSYELVDKLLEAAPRKIPFYCSLCGAIKFPVQPLRDLVLVFPSPLPEVHKDSAIIIPEQYREDYRDEYGYVLAVGPGYYDKKGRFHPTQLKVGERVVYDKGVPWRYYRYADDGNRYVLRIMGEQDVKAVVTLEESV